jgi:hypothetical protein
VTHQVLPNRLDCARCKSDWGNITHQSSLPLSFILLTVSHHEFRLKTLGTYPCFADPLTFYFPNLTPSRFCFQDPPNLTRSLTYLKLFFFAKQHEVRTLIVAARGTD